MTKLRIGVAMPTLNQGAWISRALDSFFCQTVRAPLCVVDDGCTDGTLKEVAEAQRRFPERELRLIRHDRNAGTAAAINTGIARLLAEWPDLEALSWISSDNEMMPQWLALLGGELDRGAGAAYGGFWCVPTNAPGAVHPHTLRRRGWSFIAHAPRKLVDEVNCYYGPAFLIRRDVWEAAGPHRGGTAHDFDHWLRVEEACWARGLRISGVNLPLCVYNMHDKRATVVRRDESDAPKWQAAARERRAAAAR